MQTTKPIATALALALAAFVFATMGQLRAGESAPAGSVEAEHSLPLYLFTYRPGPAWKAGAPMGRQNLATHAAYWKRMVAGGRAFAAGGFSTSEGGMAIVIAANIDEARAMLAADPAILNGVFTATIEEWTPRYRTNAPLPTAR